MPSSTAEWRPFTPQGVCEIVKQCALSGVRVFSYRGLEFDLRTVDEITVDNFRSPPQFNMSPAGAPPTEEEKVLGSEHERNLRQSEIDFMRLTDPEGFEEKIIAGELTPEPDGDADAREESF